MGIMRRVCSTSPQRADVGQPTPVKRRKDRLLQQRASLSTDGMHRRKRHPAPLVKAYVKRSGLKGRTTHASHVLDEVRLTHDARTGRLHREPFGLRTRDPVNRGEFHAKRLALSSPYAYRHATFARDLPYRETGPFIERMLATDHAHKRPHRHRSRRTTGKDDSCLRLVRCQGGDELAWVRNGANLQQIALVYGLMQ
jgi:hypothetical protein